MRNEISLEDYIKELDLMDKQYGQEEELYPLINMILRANCKLDGLSLRDVHSSKSKGIKRNLLIGYAGFPDLVILDENYKPVDNDEFNKYDVDMSKNEYEDYKFNGYVKFMYGSVEMKSPHKKFNAFDETKDKKEVIEIRKDYFDEQKTNEENDKHQVMGQLLWYGKVLFTNGYTWQYIEIDEKFNRINVPKERIKRKNNKQWIDKGYTIGDKYEVNLPCKVKNIGELDKDAKYSKNNIQQWNRLKYNLSVIDWKGTNFNWEEKNDINKFI